MLILKKQKTSCELPLQLYVDGINLIKLKLSELHPEYDYIIVNAYLKFLVKMQIYQKKKQLFIVVTAAQNKLMTLKDKKSICDPFILLMTWSQILGAVLTSREKDCKEFWNSQCKENSLKLWFPTETDYADLHSNLYNLFSNSTILNSWFSTKIYVNPQVKNCQKTFSPSFKYSLAEKWEEDAIRIIKIKLNPTPAQKKIFNRWAGTTRYVYNKLLNIMKLDPTLDSINGYQDLSKRYISSTNSDIIEEWEEKYYYKSDNYIFDWELLTPKDIRKGALRDIQKANTTIWANIKAGNIKHFELKERKKKDMNEQSMEIPKLAIQIKKSGIFIYKRFLPSIIKIAKRSLNGISLKKITHDCRLKKENNNWYLCIPVDIKNKTKPRKERVCALDPGVRKFQTIYSEENITIIEPNKERINKLQARLDLFQGLRAKKKISKQSYDRRRSKIQEKLNNLINEMHYKTISYLTKNYTSILLPSFETQEMVKNPALPSNVKRKMINYSFYKFQQRLQHKCNVIKNCNLKIVNESYTSQTCGYCGYLNKTSDEQITCGECNKTYDRDINGSRNILLKYVSEV